MQLINERFPRRINMLLSERHSKILGSELTYKFNPDIWTLRVNTIKSSVADMESIFEKRGYRFEKIPWCVEGFWIWTDDVVTKTTEYSEGLITSQSSSSMLPPIILNPVEDDLVLDMAASPGSKTTQMSAMMRNEGAIMANDIDRRRLTALQSNLQRCGSINVAVLMNRGEDIWKSGLKFDKILLDAPCTGTGTMNPRILKETGLSTINGFARRQKSLIKSASMCLKEGGVLVYSTCSLEPEENEGIVEYAVSQLGMRTLKIKTDKLGDFKMETLEEWEGREFSKGVGRAVRIKPTEKTEGFFACALSL